MSLIAWFPLNGNKTNVCGSSYAMTAGSNTYTTGKVTSQALRFSGNSGYFTNPFIGLSSWSLSFWYRANTPNTWSDIFTFSGSYGRIEFSAASGAQLTWYQNNTTYGELISNGTTFATGLSNLTWYNIVLTFNKGTTTIYLNGVKKLEQTNKTNYTASASTLYFATRADLGNTAAIDVNDIKCYNHCLSEREISELAKGMVLQYSFDTGKPNLLSRNGLRNETSDVYGFASIGLGTGFLKNNTTYTLTICGYTSQVANKDSYLRVYVYDAGWAYQTWSIPIYSQKECLTTLTFTTGANATSYNYCITAYHFPSGSAGQGNTSTIKWYKLEEGAVSTANTVNSSYTHVADNTGHGHHATSIGCTLATESKSGKLSLDTVPNGYVQLPNVHLDNSFTICGWVKHVGSFATWARIFDFGTAAGGGDYAIGLATSDANGTICLFGRTGAGAALPDTYIEQWAINTWYHFAITVDGTAIKYYVNGELRYSFTANGAIGGRTYTLNYLAKSNWNDLYSRKYMSDFRIYNTALNVTDILAIYKNKAIFDNKYNVHTSGFIEKQNGKFDLSETGNMSAIEFAEEGVVIDNGYELVEYLQSSGTQYINTGVGWVNGQSLTFEVTLQFLSTNNTVGSGHHRAVISCGGGKVQIGGVATNLDATAWNTARLEWGTGNIDSTISYNGYGNGALIGSHTTQPYDSNPYLLFACCSWNDSTGEPPYSTDTVRISKSKMYVGGKLVRDFVAARRMSDQALGMYDLVNKQFYTNRGTGTFTCGKRVTTADIDEYNISMHTAEYEQLEYIQSSGTQQINTGVYFDMENDSCQVDFCSTVASQNGMIFASNQGTNHFWFYHYKDSSRIDLYINNSSSQVHIGGQSIDTRRHRMRYFKKTYYLDNNYCGRDTRALNITNYPIYLCSWGSNYYYSGRIFGCKIWKGKSLVRNFVPVKRKSDGAIGLYDKVTKAFYGNTGTGVFTAGASLGELNIIKVRELKEDM